MHPTCAAPRKITLVGGDGADAGVDDRVDAAFGQPEAGRYLRGGFRATSGCAWRMLPPSLGHRADRPSAFRRVDPGQAVATITPGWAARA
jgi:hypothetical protein